MDCEVQLKDQRNHLEPEIELSMQGSTALVDLGRFFSFVIYTQLVGLLGRGISPSQGRYLQNNTQCTQTSMPLVAFEPTTPVFERAKTVHALDRAATVIGNIRYHISDFA
jgi:hypothetical protein